mgnify:CR=1 FL=1
MGLGFGAALGREDTLSTQLLSLVRKPFSLDGFLWQGSGIPDGYAARASFAPGRPDLEVSCGIVSPSGGVTYAEPSLSAAFGAAVGQPDSMVVSAMGDGSFGFTCGELETVVRRGVPLKMIVFSNSVYGWIKASQKTGYDERYFSVDFNRTNHARVAEAFGVKAWQVKDPSDLESSLKAALMHDGPALIDIFSQPLQDTAVPVSQWMG